MLPGRYQGGLRRPENGQAFFGRRVRSTDSDGGEAVGGLEGKGT